MKSKKLLTLLFSCIVIGGMAVGFVGCEKEDKKTNNSSLSQQQGNNNTYNPSQTPNDNPPLETLSPSVLKFVSTEDETGYSVTGIETLNNTDIVIPETYNDLPVVSIAAEAFDNIGITSVIIPDSVTSIGNKAFFRSYQLKSVVIGNSVTTLGSQVFQQCGGLKSVVIGNSVTSIGESAFAMCQALTDIVIPDSVKSIGLSAFINCSDLKSVVIGNSVISIGEYAFNGCSALTELTIPKSVKTIMEGAFAESENLIKITYEGTIEEWGLVSKSLWWNDGVPATQVVCQDGNVTL